MLMFFSVVLVKGKEIHRQHTSVDGGETSAAKQKLTANEEKKKEKNVNIDKIVAKNSQEIINYS